MQLKYSDLAVGARDITRADDSKVLRLKSYLSKCETALRELSQHSSSLHIPTHDPMTHDIASERMDFDEPTDDDLHQLNQSLTSGNHGVLFSSASE